MPERGLFEVSNSRDGDIILSKREKIEHIFDTPFNGIDKVLLYSCIEENHQ